MNIVTDDLCAGFSSPGHPERPERLLAIVEQRHFLAAQGEKFVLRDAQMTFGSALFKATTDWCPSVQIGGDASKTSIAATSPRFES